MEIEIIAIECDKDHTHMFLNCLPILSPVDIMQKIKGVTSRALRDEFKEVGDFSSKMSLEESEVNIVSSYILTLKLDTEAFQEDILSARLEIGRNIYNSCLAELYKRYNHMRESKQYKKISQLYKGKDRNKQFNELNNKYGLTEYSLHNFVKPIQKHFKDNIDSFSAQKIATRCFGAFQKLMFHIADKVQFKKYGEMNSVEGKSNKTGIRFKNDKLVWNRLEIDILIKNIDTYAQKAIQDGVKYCRIVRKMIRGKYKYYVQLIMEGHPPVKTDKETGKIKRNIGLGNVGIDIGTRTIAISSMNDVKLLELCPEMENVQKNKNVLQRKLDRQSRASNSNNFNEDRTIKRGIKLTNEALIRNFCISGMTLLCRCHPYNVMLTLLLI
jgi:hypothetical protein